MENSSKTQKPKFEEPEPEISNEEIDEVLRKLYAKLKDFLSLDVITIKGDFEVFNPADTKETDIIKIASSLPGTIKVLAQTHMQLDGDCLNAIATDKVGQMTHNDINTFHNETLKAALQHRIDRYQLLIDLITKLRERRKPTS